jgi:hypothetical protein
MHRCDTALHSRIGGKLCQARALMKLRTSLTALIALELTHAALCAQLPAITSQPGSLVVGPGATVSLTVGVSGSGPFS